MFGRPLVPCIRCPIAYHDAFLPAGCTPKHDNTVRVFSLFFCLFSVHFNKQMKETLRKTTIWCGFSLFFCDFQ